MESEPEPFQFRTRINPSWLAAVRVLPRLVRVESPFPLMNLVAREKGVTAVVEAGTLVLSIGPGVPLSVWPLREIDLLGLLRRHGDAISLLNAIREAAAPVQAVVRPRPAAQGKPRVSRAQKSTASVSVPVGNALSGIGPDDVWAAIRSRQGAPFSVIDLEAILGPGVAPYVMLWARDGHLVKVDRGPGGQAPWRYRLLRDQPSPPPIG
jgi:hypothetical protein